LDDLITPLNTCERVLDALRSYDERDEAIDALIAEIEAVRAGLIDALYGRSAADEPLTRERLATT
jgi:uncharacterized small protein (DUF1192 family)